MPDQSLHENGEPCPACELQVEALGDESDVILRAVLPCQICGGTRRVAIPTPTIIERAVAWAREHHWPAFDKRNRL